MTHIHHGIDDLKWQTGYSLVMLNNDIYMYMQET